MRPLDEVLAMLLNRAKRRIELRHHVALFNGRITPSDAHTENGQIICEGTQHSCGFRYIPYNMFGAALDLM